MQRADSSPDAAEEDGLKAFHDRVGAVVCQQYAPDETLTTVEHLLTDQWVTANPYRPRRPGAVRGKHPETESKSCPLCRYETPSHVMVIDMNLQVRIPSETASTCAARAHLEDQDPRKVETYLELVKGLAEFNQKDIQGPYLARVLPNLIPPLGRGTAFLVAFEPRYHGVPLDEVSRTAVNGMIRAWAFLEDYASRHGQLAIAFVNHGAAAGATLPCPHSQVYLLNYVPRLYQRINQRNEPGRCAMCRMLENETVDRWAYYKGPHWVAYAHPTGVGSVIVVPTTHVAELTHLSVEGQQELADVLQRSIGAMKHIHGGAVPPHNLWVRSGKVVGHLHAELQPRTSTPAGYELATHDLISVTDPTVLKDEMQRFL